MFQLNATIHQQGNSRIILISCHHLILTHLLTSPLPLPDYEMVNTTNFTLCPALRLDVMSLRIQSELP